jgi:hypothetical protein
MNLECLLCGVSGPQVRPALVEWRDPIVNERFTSMPRCVDVRECRERVLQRGGEWPLVDSTSERRSA